MKKTYLKIVEIKQLALSSRHYTSMYTPRVQKMQLSLNLHSLFILTFTALNFVMSLSANVFITWRTAKPKEHKPCKMGCANPCEKCMVNKLTRWKEQFTNYFLARINNSKLFFLAFSEQHILIIYIRSTLLCSFTLWRE